MDVQTSFPYYQGNGLSAATSPKPIPTSSIVRRSRADSYLPDKGLIDAANVALLLGQPLLLTGSPGTGKTQFAYHLAWELGFGDPLKFETKSTSTASELFYIYNTVGRFHAAQTGEGSQNSVDYITYNALGKAILRAKPAEEIRPLVVEHRHHDGPQRSVVLIDEIDKAPRDFPNDILNEVEGMYFRIPELGNTEVRAGSDFQPVVVITSNSEKHLPDAFLRRCVYYHIQFPDRDRLEDICLAHLGQSLRQGQRLLEDALDLFLQLRNPENNLRKAPATAELLNWLLALRTIHPSVDEPLAHHPETIFQTLGTVTKTREDHEVAKEVVNDWLEQ